MAFIPTRLSLGRMLVGLPWPWQHALGDVPWPWGYTPLPWLRAHGDALAMTLALAASCLGFG